MGNRAAAYYAVALVVVALVGGTITDRLVFSDAAYVPPTFDATVATGHESDLAVTDADGAAIANGFSEVASHIPMWHYPFMVLLIGVMGIGIARRLGRAGKHDDSATHACET
jgi:hypothetical protein